MLSAIDRMRHAQIWNLLYEYADIRDQLEDLFNSLHLLQQSIEVELDDLSEEFDDLQERMNSVSGKLFRFKNPEPQDPEELPFDTRLRELPEEEFPFYPDPEDEIPFQWEDASAQSEAR